MPDQKTETVTLPDPDEYPSLAFLLSDFSAPDAEVFEQHCHAAAMAHYEDDLWENDWYMQHLVVEFREFVRAQREAAREDEWEAVDGREALEQIESSWAADRAAVREQCAKGAEEAHARFFLKLMAKGGKSIAYDQGAADMGHAIVDAIRKGKSNG
jgi:hypothetical protein